MQRVSVLIRNRNEAAGLRCVLTRLRRQRTQPCEIVVVDNESTDDSVQVIQEFGCKLIRLSKADFTYGRATNLGFEHCEGDLVLMLSSHSLPIGRSFIEDVSEPFEDPRVAALRIPIAGRNETEITRLEHWKPLDRESSAKEIFRRGPVASGCVIRRSVWEEHRMDETLGAAEDKEWAMRVLRRGDWTIPGAEAAYTYARALTTERRLQKFRREESAGFEAAGLLPPVSLRSTLAQIFRAQSRAFQTARVEIEMYLFRRKLKNRLAVKNTGLPLPPQQVKSRDQA